ncbi:MAG: hypothetical protein EOM21_13625 [Gammaproteobacteria bacterium]|nr:hypothetical protein [Gammaproteobacteria bacterium]
MSEEMGFDLDTLFVDQSAATSGVWVDFFGGSRLKLGSTEGKKYKSLLARLAKKNRIALDDSNEESFELIQEITAEALATEVLRDWEGINLGGQKNVPYTPAMGKLAILSSGKLRDFITDRAGDPALFKPAPIEAAAEAAPAPTLAAVG